MSRITHWAAAFATMTVMTSPLAAQLPQPSTMLPGWLSAPRPAASWALPPITMSARAPATDDRTSPMVDTAHVRRRSATFDLGPLSASIEGLRGRTLADGATRTKFWATGLHVDWPVANGDTLALGLNQSFTRAAQPKWLTARPPVATSSSLFEMHWLHDDRWRLSLGWERIGGGRSVSGAERLADIADGAPLHESGIRASLTLMPMGIDSPGALSLGIEGRAEAIARDDLLLVGAGRRQDDRVSIFLRSRF